MTENVAITKGKENMDKTIEVLNRSLANIRAGKANASILNNVKVLYYGATVPLNQVASINVPEARVLLVTPYDKTVLDDIEHAINSADLGLNPANDGDVIRLVIPQLTGERRQEIAKQVGKEAESARVAVRNVRREAMDSIKKQEKNGDITEDDFHDIEDQIQKLTDSSVEQINKLAEAKEKEITEG
ncbi:ribosome recycling factor [Companilactobacillus mishanensis]|uniref:Ribosome-recycling factor n=1 Tax=Companilactobacillus mishanensis TaxID=2486008 RepID=A0A5P0ZEP0_9LACO|nr:ribosome recycling factor [Companilactobacillus mishanensis]MQS44388.1 ribosome recycling factor [Companilactobacillus mishanensis]MQS51510.1 ribosome recycling factor [Companilactobacillus mishanensis]MQS88629.1 ribosome recycling factor [Companilactobacillus mishanensis]